MLIQKTSRAYQIFCLFFVLFHSKSTASIVTTFVITSILPFRTKSKEITSQIDNSILAYKGYLSIELALYTPFWFVLVSSTVCHLQAMSFLALRPRCSMLSFVTKARCAGSSQSPGSQTTLPSSSPIRTVLDSFPSHGSSS